MCIGGGVVETFDAAEERLLGVIAEALGFEPVEYGAVREADLVLLVTEARDLLGAGAEGWGMRQVALEERIVPLDWEEAERVFLRRFEELRG